MDEESVLDFLTSLEAMDLPDRIEEVNQKILSKIIEDTDYVAVLFCKFHICFSRVFFFIVFISYCGKLQIFFLTNISTLRSFCKFSYCRTISRGIFPVAFTQSSYLLERVGGCLYIVPFV